MKQIILGTAGHIDHGKTALIKALTGINTDRLKEEKLRGITIELGFASLTLPSGQHVGIIDVPGHEKFVKNMVAGATGIDVVAMVIAADEGIMPQTKEHMEICTLLNIKHGIIVLSKTDLVDEEWLELVLEDIRDYMKGTFLENANILPVSATSGEGISQLITALDDICALVPKRQSSGIFRLPVDRVFSIKGFGTVITGTLISGKIRTGDTIMIYPSGIKSKIRGIQVHNKAVDIAETGMRTAINFQGLDKASVNRGDVLANSDSLISIYMIDVFLQFLSTNPKPIKNRTVIRFHSGTSEIFGNLILLDREELLPGESTSAQLRLESNLVVVKDDRFILRSYSPIRTIGGGYIINPIPGKHKRFKKEIIEGLKIISGDKHDQIISYQVKQSLFEGISFSKLLIMTNIAEKQLNNILQGLMSKKTVIQADKENRIYIHDDTYNDFKQQTIDFIENFHNKHPLKTGIYKEEFRSRFSHIQNLKIFNFMLNNLTKGNEIIQEDDLIRLSTHTVSLALDQAGISKKMLEIYSNTKLTPPYFKELVKTLEIDHNQAKDVLILLIGQKKIVKIKENLFFHKNAVDKLKNELVDFLLSNGEITTPQFKNIAKVSRKYLIPLIEYFDATNITIRVGDIRKLRNKV